ncbi:MAG TPA: ABC transporter permease [Candidatus Angelobacter sp.]
MHSLVHDLRYAFRQLRNSPGFTATAVLTLALGIGANTAIFSVMNSVLLRGLPVPDPQELVYLYVLPNQPSGASNTGNSETSFSEPVFEQLRQDHRAFAEVMAFVPLSLSGKAAIRFSDTPEEAEGDMVSGNFFSGLGVQLSRGRGFIPDDEKNHTPVAVLSYSYWERRFGRNPSVLGQSFFIKGIPFTVIGIAPEKFYGVEPGNSTDFWIPLQSRPELNAWGTPTSFGALYGTPRWWCLELIARLQKGVSAESAMVEANPAFAAAAYIGISKPDLKAQKPVLSFKPARGIEGLDTESSYQRAIVVLMTLVGLVLVIACVNVTTLLVAKKSARQREFSLRLALGASHSRIFQQLLLESLLLVVGGAVLAWFFALLATRALAVWAEIESGLAPDGTVLLFTLAVSGVAALLFGLAPYYQATRVPAAMALRTGAASGHQTRLSRWSGNMVMSAQMALCFMLLVAAGLLMRTLHNYETTDLGMKTQGLLVFGITPQKTANNAQSLQFYRDLLDRLRRLPGVESATVMENRLGSGWSDNNTAVLDGVHHTFQEAPLRSNTVGPDYFHVLGVPVLHGREITDADTETSQPVAVVNETFVKRLLPHTDPLGHRLGEKTTIIGVVKDSKYTQVSEKPQPMAYYAYTQAQGVAHMEVEVRTTGNPTALLDSIRRSIQSLDPNLPVENPMTQQAVFEHSYQSQQMFSRLSSFFGLLAAFLVVIGLYGTFSYRVSRRTAEIGVRMALGAARPTVLWMLLRESLVVATMGLVLGLPIALFSAGVMESLLYGLKPRDPITFALSLVIVILVSLAASFLPARQAASIEPMKALRAE